MLLEDFFRESNVADFFSESWGRKPLLLPAPKLNVSNPEGLLERLLNLRRLRYPQVRVLNGGGALNPLLYTASTRYGFNEDIIGEKVSSLAVAPNTIKIEDLESLDEEFGEWGKALREVFNSKITLNGYFSFGPSEGIPVHYDPHHIFAVQLFGAKDWMLGKEQAEQYPHQAFTMEGGEVIPPSIPIKLGEGQMLYLPPGRMHSVRTNDVSVHVAIGVHTPRCFQGVSSLLEKATALHPELRSEMPFVVSQSGLQFKDLRREELEAIFEIVKSGLNE